MATGVRLTLDERMERAENDIDALAAALIGLRDLLRAQKTMVPVQDDEPRQAELWVSGGPKIVPLGRKGLTGRTCA